MEAPLALYRRYRPETFAEVIGQDHVTAPLRAALNNNRVNHAYLFSGPRGCGKTTSARILARCLNCEKGPTDEPCGVCQSCTDLARGGPGSIDVIEIDAASHGGVEDARDLRERAFFAPVNSRYKVYIIDEAHMVSPQGFNALLKLVEEPPEHLKFVFATTEPEKVIGTIRSRTHHYPFRLIPPRTLSDYLRTLCVKEGVEIEAAALPLVVRAGAGSARDTLSVLDQLIGGAGPDGVTYELATGLLGYTPESLLDEVVDAFAAGDGATVFGVVDKVIETGQDPRRFTEDLLRRLRDLVIISAVPDAPATGLIDVAQDQGERLVAQAARFGRADLTRAAELVADGLMDLKGATAPRLLLELICARVLLPGADDGTEGVMARLDRIEKRMSIEGVPSAAGPAGSATVGAGPAARVEASASRVGAPTAGGDVGPTARAPAAPAQDAAAPGGTDPGGGTTSGLTLVDVRRLWPDLLEAVKLKRRFTWILLSQNAQVAAVDDRTLTIALINAGARSSFVSGGSEEILRQAAIDVIGHDWRVESIVDPSAQPGSEPRIDVVRPAVPGPDAGSEAVREPTPSRRASATAPEAPDASPHSGPQHSGPQHSGPQQSGPQSAGPPPWAGPEQPEPTAGPADPARVHPSDEPSERLTQGTGGRSQDRPSAASARGAIQDTRPGGGARRSAGPAVSDEDVDRDDPAAEDAELGGAELLRRELGASIIEETTSD